MEENMDIGMETNMKGLGFVRVDTGNLAKLRTPQILYFLGHRVYEVFQDLLTCSRVYLIRGGVYLGVVCFCLLIRFSQRVPGTHIGNTFTQIMRKTPTTNGFLSTTLDTNNPE